MNSHNCKDYLIVFSPGARGDFLAAILLDQFDQHYNDYCLSRMYHTRYQKVHWCNDIVGRPRLAKTYIRIRLNTVDDFLTVAHLWREKITTDPLPMENILLDLLQHEFEARHMDQEFDHVVNFADLFDVNAVHQIYKTITNKDLSAAVLEKIQHNIELQQFVTTCVKNRL